MKSNRMYLEHILESIERVESFCSCGRDEFMKNPMIQDATIRNFEIIGEAAKRLSDDVRIAYPNISWSDIAGFRDVLIHDYMGVNLKLVWNVVENHLPALKKAVSELLKKY